MENIVPNTKDIAFILDGQVVEVMHTEERLASILLSNPVAVDVTGQTTRDGGEIEYGVNYNYMTGKLFKLVQVEIPTNFQSTISSPALNDPNVNLNIVNENPPCGCGK